MHRNMGEWEKKRKQEPTLRLISVFHIFFPCSFICLLQYSILNISINLLNSPNIITKYDLSQFSFYI